MDFSKIDPPPAFPERCMDGTDRSGMTLLDWFAGMALAAGVPTRTAADCYDIAAWMVEERKSRS